jgi:hypothetical protein
MAHLTEPGIRAYCLTSLQSCKDTKMKYYTKVVNLTLLCAFIAGAAIILYCKYKGRRSPLEKKQKNELDRLHILNRIKQIQIDKRKDTNLILTDVPSVSDFF